MLLIVVVFSGLVGKIAIPTLAAVLIFAAASSLRTGRIDTIARTGMASRIAFVTTLLATLVLPVAAAVGIGVSLSLLLQLGQEAEDLTVMRAQLARRRPLRRGARAGAAAERRRDAAPRLRQPPVRGCADAAGAPAGPGRRDAPRRDPAPARPQPARRDVVHRARRLRGAAPRGRRAPLPQRRRSGARRAAHPHAPRRRARTPSRSCTRRRRSASRPARRTRRRGRGWRPRPRRPAPARARPGRAPPRRRGRRAR